jgi:hypothetical protein
MHIITRDGVGWMATIRRLSFPFPTTIEAIEGNVWYTASGHTRLLRHRQRVHALPLALCDIGLTCNGIVSIRSDVDSIHRNANSVSNGCDTKNLTHQVARKFSSTMPLARTLALNVFRSPHFAWTQDFFSSNVELSKREISRQLFIQGKSFRQIVHMQRLIRFLCDLHKIPYIDDSVARKYGFSHCDRLEDAVYEQFDLTLESLWRTFGHWRFPVSELALSLPAPSHLWEIEDMRRAAYHLNR